MEQELTADEDITRYIICCGDNIILKQRFSLCVFDNFFCGVTL